MKPISRGRENENTEKKLFFQCYSACVGLVLTGCAGYLMESKKSAKKMQDMQSMILKRDTSLGAVPHPVAAPALGLTVPPSIMIQAMDFIE